MFRPSDELVRAAQQQAASRPEAAFQRQRYEELARDFRIATPLSRSGVRHAVEEITSDTGVLPPSPPTLRGRVGRRLIILEVRAFWWVLRAFRLRDRALQRTYAALLQQEQRIDALETELSTVRSRLERLERERRQHSEE